MTRIKGHSYPVTTAETVRLLLAHRSTLANAPMGTTEALLAGLPQGAITKARMVTGDNPYAGLIAFTIKDRNERYIEPEGFFMLRALALFEPGGVFIDKSGGTEAERKDYPEVFGNLGITVLRLLADAQRGEMVKLTGDHHDLSASRLAIVKGAANLSRGRREALAEALKAYDHNAKEWGLNTILSRWDYQVLLRDAFRLYDLKHGHHFIAEGGQAATGKGSPS